MVKRDQANGLIQRQTPTRKRKYANAKLAVLKDTVKLSSLQAKGNSLLRLAYDNRFLVPLALTVDDERAVLVYTLDKLSPVSGASKNPLTDKYRLLSNINELAPLFEQFSFSLDPDNVYFDYNLSVKALRRDIQTSTQAQAEFLRQYKCLCGHVLQNKYDYSAYYNGGQTLLDKHKRLRQINKCETSDEIAALLMEWYEDTCLKVKKTKKLVNKKGFAILITVFVLAAIVAVAGSVYAFYTFRVQLPYEERLIAASNAYLHEDLDGVIATLRNESVSALPKEARYILARSYVQTESLSAQQKSQILSGLTLKTEDNIINYWIELGRRQYETAKDIAQRINDDELLLYCLLKYEVDTQQDTTLTGEEKTNKVDALQKEIDSLTKKMDEQAQQAAGEGS